MKKAALISLLFLTLPMALTGCGKSDMPKAGTEDAEHSAEGNEHTEAEGEHGENIELTDEQVAASGIQIAQAGPAKIRETLQLYGSMAPNAERMREVTARYPGVVRTVSKRVGDSVREGEVLATVESNESLRTYSIVAPLSGVVIQRKANPGEYTGETMVFTVADLSTVWVELSLFPRDVAEVHVGQSVRIKSPDTNLSGDGKVVYVAPFGQSANQTLTARVLLDNAEKHWAPGLYVTAEVTLAETAVPVAIRSESVQTMESGSVVFVKSEEGFAPVAVTLGRADGEFSDVLSGLKAGQLYAAANSFILKAELGKGEAEH